MHDICIESGCVNDTKRLSVNDRQKYNVRHNHELSDITANLTPHRLSWASSDIFIQCIKCPIRVNTVINQGLRLNGEDITRSSDFCYLGSVVAEDGGANTDVHVRIQKAGGSFSKLRKVWLSTLIRKDTKIKIFSACVKSVLL